MLKVRTLCEILDLICLHECVGGLQPRIFTDIALLFLDFLEEQFSLTLPAAGAFTHREITHITF